MGAAVAAVSQVGTVVGTIEKIFGGNGFPQQKSIIDGWVATITANIGQRNNPATPAGDAFLRLRCWSGDNTVITPGNTQELFGGPRSAAGCGCETEFGCRDYAKAAVTTINQLAGVQNPNTGIGGGLVGSIFPTSNSGSGSNPLIPLLILGVILYVVFKRSK